VSGGVFLLVSPAPNAEPSVERLVEIFVVKGLAVSRRTASSWF